MSSELFMFDEPFYHQNPTPSAMDDPFSDSSIDTLLQEISKTEPQCGSKLTQIAQTLLSDSPPSNRFEGLSLCQQTHFSNPPDSTDFSGGYFDYSVSGVKTEEEPPMESRSYFVGSQSYGGCEEGAVMRLLRRSYSNGGHSYDGEKPWFIFQPRFDALFESPAFLCSPENGLSGGHIRRVCSTGDLPKVNNNLTSAQGESNATTLMEEINFKVGRYNSEERKEKIERYRAKRNQRNFNKTIKYACRKTLADSRPRVRGRFARNDEPGEMPKLAPCSNRYEDEDDILLYKWHEEEDVEIGGGGRGGGDGGCGDGRGQFLNSQFGASSELHQYLGF